jgi:hypothetical protein
LSIPTSLILSSNIIVIKSKINVRIGPGLFLNVVISESLTKLGLKAPVFYRFGNNKMELLFDYSIKLKARIL